MGSAPHPKYLKNSINEFMEAMEVSDSIFLALDLEGTLTESQGFFDPIELPDALIDALQSIASNERFTVSIFGLHKHQDMADAIPIKDIILVSSASQHITVGGMVIVNPSIRSFGDKFDSIEEILGDVNFHRSDYMLSVDTKGMKRTGEGSISDVVNRIKTKLAELGESRLGLRITPGSINIYDITWTKADALNMVLGQMSYDTITPVYFGDDLSDEPVFEFVNRFPGQWSVIIMRGHKKTAARYYLKSVDELTSLLIRLGYACDNLFSDEE